MSDRSTIPHRTSAEFAIREACSRLGYYNLKEELMMVVKNFVESNDVFVCLPTGFGKSLCHSCLPGIYDILHNHDSPYSTVIVVSPLLALTSDQISSLKRKGISAVKICSDSGDELRDFVMKGQYQLIFTSPELLMTDESWCDVFQSSTFCDRMVAFVVDEAHCAKKWGTSFRKEFSRLGDLRGFFPVSIHIMALTATASPTTQREVIRLLGMQKPVIVSRSPDKANVVYCVVNKETDMEEAFCSLIEEVRLKRCQVDKTIIFCRTYKDTSQLYLLFKSKLGPNMTQPVGYPLVSKFRLVDMFTACNTSSLKNSILKSFCELDSRLRIVIATIAFGMGIDCPNIRRVIHWGPPSDIESYIQETGRAGRDGQIATAALFFNKRDISFSYIEKSMVSYCVNHDTCRRLVLFVNFGNVTENKPVGCMCCDICARVCNCDKCELK